MKKAFTKENLLALVPLIDKDSILKMCTEFSFEYIPGFSPVIFCDVFSGEVWGDSSLRVYDFDSYEAMGSIVVSDGSDGSIDYRNPETVLNLVAQSIKREYENASE